jgi:3-oxoacyl-[acyl-carrier protein] reductase
MTLSGKAAIVTGGAQGIGKATVIRLTEAGAQGVVIADINAKGAVATAKEIMAAHGGQVLAVPTDVTDPSQVEAMVQETIRSFGRVDILVNNAGITPEVAWDDATLESWDHLLKVNLTSMFLCTKAVIPSMKANRYGRIVFVSSEAAFDGSYVAHVAYGVTKAGVLALMKSVAKGFAADGIRANAVAPGAVDTPLSHSLSRDFWVAFDERTLLKRHATPFEIADAVLFLVSDSSSYITGQVLRVNGGRNLT